MDGKLRIEGVEYPVTLDPDSGVFTADLNGHKVSAGAWSTLKNRARSHLNGERVEVEVGFVDLATRKRGIAFAVNHASGRVKVRWRSGNRQESVDVSRALRPTTDLIRLQQLEEAVVVARQNLAQFIAANVLGRDGNLYDVVMAAVAEETTRREQLRELGGSGD